MEFLKKALLGLAAGFLNGLFGSGGGTVVVPGMEKLLGLESKKAHATAISIILPLTLLSVLIYMKKFSPDYKALLFVSAGGCIGGFAGAKLLNKIKNDALHKIFGVCLVAAAVRMIL